jgi:murein DD-endopeptidase MepM/ murein hydrolase activator NlpD
LLTRLRLLVVVVALVLCVGGWHLRLAQSQSNVVLSFNFDFIRQGHVGVITASGDQLVGGVVATLDRQYPFFPVSGGWAALVSVPLDQKIKADYPLSLTLYQSDGTNLASEALLRVESGEYIREPDFRFPSDRLYLLNMDIQVNEDYRLKLVYGGVTPERLWEGQFSIPVNAITTSPFGSVRAVNDGSSRRHTGVDFKIGAGQPIQASATGRVVFARQLDIHGNCVIIDHGWGVFTSYSHLSDMVVVPGQIVLQGEIIGLVGNTGRSTGAHLHWEIAVNGNWVSPMEFAKLKLP